MLGNVLDDRFDRLLGVAQLAQRPRHGVVDNLQRTAADHLLELHERQVRLDPGGVTVHHQADSSGRCEHRGLRVAVAVLLPQRQHVGPDLGCDRMDVLVEIGVTANDVVRSSVLAHHPLVWLSVTRVALIRSDDCSELGRPLVRSTCHQRSDRTGQRPTGVGVVGQA